MVGIGKMTASIDPHIVTDAAIFINDGILDIATVANTRLRYSFIKIYRYLINGFVMIITHNITTYNGSAMPNSAPDTDHTIFNSACIND